MSRVLVTGASGFAGRHLLRACLEAGDDAVALTRSGAAPGARSVAADLRDAAAAAAVVAEARPDVVYHLAGQASVGAAWADPEGTLSANLDTTRNVLEAIREHAPRARVVFAGSGEVYGPPETLPTDETAPLRPQNPYAVSKAASDLLAGMYADAHGLEVVRARAFNHAGPGQSDEFVVATIARQAAEGLLRGDDPIPVVTGSPEPRRDFTDVRDVVRAYRLLGAGGAAAGAYNVCSGVAVPVSELVAATGRAIARELAHTVDPARVRAHEVMEVRGSAARLREATGWAPEIPLERTLADAVEWWRRELSG